jgi:hemolysin activation/secretion protein
VKIQRVSSPLYVVSLLSILGWSAGSAIAQSIEPQVVKPQVVEPQAIGLESTNLGSANLERVSVESINLASFQVAQIPPGTVLPEERQIRNSVLDPQQKPPSQQPIPEQRIERLPSPDELLPKSPAAPPTGDPGVDIPQTIVVKQFTVTGSTVFSQADFTAAIAEKLGTFPPDGRSLTLSELFDARAAVTQLYVNKGYITSGAFIPPQPMQGGTIEIRVLEGKLEDIKVTGLRRLKPGYVASRIAIATKAPLNREKLLESLQLLQLNPLIGSVSAELSAGARPGTSLLEVKVTEADANSVTLTFDNGRSPSVGTVRRQIQGLAGNLLGYGDSLSASFTNTDGSNAFDFSYTIPVSPRNTTLSFSAGLSTSKVIEAPFDILDIQSESNYFEFTGRHPLIQTPTKELALGLTFSRRSIQTSLLDDIPFPSPGADVEGRTKETVFRFFQEYTARSSQSVFAVRSQFNLGVNALGATINDDGPDGRFLSWRGQAQWVRLLAPDTLFLVRGDLQFSDRTILPVEQFGLGGLLSVRGYRQDLLLTDNGFFASAEVRIPVLRLPKQQAILFFTPFADLGKGWNNGESADPDPSTLASLGFGLRLQIGNNFTARMDFGFPLVKVDSRKETWQEKGIYFSIVYSPF